MDKDLNIGLLNDIYGSLLTDNQRDMIKSYYDCDLSFGEIAENLGISRQAVSDCIGKGRDALLQYEQRLGFQDKLSLIKNAIGDCLDETNIDALQTKLREIIKAI